ncbi:hypothetical protein MCHI_000876 [Candidatus Magnetoovum chiemensis]|nr:hypothetical protein MCHI_000876 [Candidatus Magnetoovum chiemensis]
MSNCFLSLCCSIRRGNISKLTQLTTKSARHLHRYLSNVNNRRYGSRQSNLLS